MANKNSAMKEAFGLTCAGCNQRLVMAEKWLMTQDNMTWTCDNCSSEFKVFGGLRETETDNIMKLTAYHTRHSEITKKVFELVDNRYFKEVKEAEQSASDGVA
jgi:hypothetical protein